MKTTYVEIPLYPENDEIFYSGRWDKENRLLVFEMTDKELHKLKEVYNEFDTYEEVVEFLINNVNEDEQYLSEFWGCEGVYVDNMDYIEEVIEQL